MSIFNDDIFNDSNNIQSELNVAKNISRNDYKKIAKQFIKHAYANSLQSDMIYEVMDNKLIIYNKLLFESRRDIKLYDGSIIQQYPLSLEIIISFNEDNDSIIDYIEIWNSYYADKEQTFISDEEYHIIKFVYTLFTQFNLIVNKIVYAQDLFKPRYDLEILDRRNFDRSKDKIILSKDFCSHIPLIINKVNKTISNKFFINKCAFEDENTLIEFCKRIISLQKCKIYINTATVYINGNGIYSGNYNKSFFDTLSEAPQYHDIDDYFIINNTYLKKLKIS